METIIKSSTDSSNIQPMINNPNIQFMPKCLLCDKTFANTSNLKHHMNTIHFNEAKWICKECGKVCTSKSNLKVHLRVHLRVKPYYCRWCDYNCMHHSSIRDHLSKCHPEKSHNSCEPGYIFNSAAVPEPELSHFDEKVFKKIDLHEQESQHSKLSSTTEESSKICDLKDKKFNSSKNFKIELKTSNIEEEEEEADGNIFHSQEKVQLSDKSESKQHETDLNQFSSNLFQQQSEIINTILRSSSSSLNGTLNFSNVAANLFQQLNVALVQKSNAKNYGLYLSDLMRNKMAEINSKALDLSIKNNERKRCKLNDNFYCSDESPVSPVSSISSSSSTTKTSNSPSSVNKSHSKKAISDVIERLNSNKSLFSRKRNSTTMLLNEETEDTDDLELKNENLSSDSSQQSSEYRCKYCNIVFNEYPLYSIHAGMHSNSNPWKCNVCGHLCSNKIDFAVHILHLSKI
ncbi:zinc finger Aiolos isoform X1 [Brachionus plicatilis]|uniref:Zinc finger Aiolos isoform X1 n=1 Tax=Brachionus plicatilis TaxID=10195 RepID=A0A3M7SE86_BRAPC|nr:zinc finger Aiolos isoform X1 [Brachionus plicatilis]